MRECGGELEQQIQHLQPHDGEPAKGKQRAQRRHSPNFDLRTQLFKMCGVDLTRIDGTDVTKVLAVISETGTDMSRFATVGHFTSWLGLCPGTQITGGKVMSGKTKRCANHAAQALRLAAAALRPSQSALGAYCRRMCARIDKPKAVAAAAHKLARLIYTMLTQGGGIRGPRAGLLRGALPPAGPAPAVHAGGKARHENGGYRVAHLKNPIQISDLGCVS